MGSHPHAAKNWQSILETKRGTIMKHLSPLLAGLFGAIIYYELLMSNTDQHSNLIVLIILSAASLGLAYSFVSYYIQLISEYIKIYSETAMITIGIAFFGMPFAELMASFICLYANIKLPAGLLSVTLGYIAFQIMLFAFYPIELKLERHRQHKATAQTRRQKNERLREA